MKKVAIIGGGLIGKCWTVLFIKSGYKVNLYDVLFTDKDTIDKALDAITSKLQELKSYGLIDKSLEPSLLVQESVMVTVDLKEALTDVIYVQECVPENVELKRKVFQQLDELVSEGVIMASSTSCIVPSSFTNDLKHKEYCIVAHPLNPPHYTPLVEVLPSPFTSETTLSKTMSLLKEIGQSPIIVKKEVNGFVVNRLQYALIMEAWRLVHEGVASAEDVDKAVSQGLGLRYSFMGPFEVMHLNAQGIQDYCELYGDNIVRVCETQSPTHPLSGPTLDNIKVAMETQVPLHSMNERRKWRDERLASLACHKKDMNQKESSLQ